VKNMKKSTFLALSILMILAACGTTAAAEMPDNNNVNLEVVNDGGARIDTYGNDTYDFFNGEGTGGLNSLKINDDASTAAEVVTTSAQSGTFYLETTGGQGRVDDGILMLAVNGTIPDNFQVHITASGYTWTPASGFIPTPSDVTYNAVTLDETFYKSDFIYGPQTWRPYYQALYPIFEKQDMTNTSNTFSVMLIDLYSGLLVNGANGFVNLIDNGGIKIQYSFQNLPLGSLAAFDAYGFSTSPESGSTYGSVQWTNRLNTVTQTQTGVSCYMVTGTAVNTAPVAMDDSASTSEDTPVTVNVLANDSDADGDSLTVSAVTQPANGSVVNNNDGTVTYTPDTGFVGQDSFTYTLSDGKGGSDTATVTVTVTEAAENTPPVAVDDSASTSEDTPVTITVLANDSDVDGDTLSVTAVVQPANGSVVNNNDGTVTYTPDTGFIGQDSFTYTASDGQGGSDTATVTVTVNGVNTAPLAVDDTTNTNEDTPVMVNVVSNDSDVDGDSLTVSGVSDPAHGSVVNNNDGTVTYTPDTNWNGQDTFTYTISDGKGGTDTATVTVTVYEVNDDPVAADDSASANEDTSVTISVLANDSDVDGDSLTVSGVSDPAHGSVVINANGTVTYTPDTGFSGLDSFTYTISDGHEGTDTATVWVYVTSIPVADLNLTKTVDKAAPAVKDTVIFTLIVNNNGPDTAVDVTVNDKLPAGLTYVSYTANYGTYDPDTGLWTIPALPNGESAVLTITSLVESSGQILNQANVTAFSWDPNLEGNAASAALNVPEPTVPETEPVPVEAQTVEMQKTGAPISGLLLAFFMLLAGMVLPKRK
jgi:uncharacterized repeat protein (TIGR01451 family)